MEEYYEHHLDGDSDNDSLEAHEENARAEAQETAARREARLMLGRSPQRAHERSAARRATAMDMDMETWTERARASRRAAVAAQKMVASAGAIAALEKVDMSTLRGDDTNCIICYNEFGVKNPDGQIETPVRLPKCKHVFGDICLKQWFKDSDTCPYCRDKLPAEPKRNLNSHAEAIHRLARLEAGISDRASLLAAMHNMDRAQQTYPTFIQQQQMALSSDLDRTDPLLDYAMRIQHEVGGHIVSSLAPGNGSRSTPEDVRRRFRPRPSSRNYNQANNRAVAIERAVPVAGSPSSRTTRSGTSQANLVRNTLVHSNHSLVDETTANQRSITPHPTTVSTSSSPRDLDGSPASQRPSSLPSDSSPLREITSVSPDHQSQPNLPPRSSDVLPRPRRDGTHAVDSFVSWQWSAPNVASGTGGAPPPSIPAQYRFFNPSGVQGERLAPYQQQSQLGSQTEGTTGGW